MFYVIIFWHLSVFNVFLPVVPFHYFHWLWRGKLSNQNEKYIFFRYNWTENLFRVSSSYSAPLFLLAFADRLTEGFPNHPIKLRDSVNWTSTCYYMLCMEYSTNLHYYKAIFRFSLSTCEYNFLTDQPPLLGISILWNSLAHITVTKTSIYFVLGKDI